MTIAIITEAGARKVGPLVVVAQQAAAAATQMAGIATAVAQGRYYASYAAGNAATSAGQYFAVFTGGNYSFHVNGNATPVFVMPKVDGSGNVTLTGGPGVTAVLTVAPDASNLFGGIQVMNGANQEMSLLAKGSTGEVNLSCGRSPGWGGNLNIIVDTVQRARFDNAGNFGLGTTSPSNNAGYNRQLQITGGLPCLTLDGTTGNRKFCIGVSSASALSIWDANAAADRLRIQSSGAVEPGGTGQDFGAGGRPWNNSYFAVSPTITSDRRAKTDIEPIGDALLDAWADVEWVRYRLVSDGSSHIGLVAQQVFEALAAHDIDAIDVGLVVHQEWAEEPDIEEMRDEQGEIVRAAQLGRPAGDAWMLRYSECEAIEAAYQRRQITAQETRLAALEERIATLATP